MTNPINSPPRPAPVDASPSEVEQLVEQIGARYVDDLRALSEAFGRFYQAQLTTKDRQIAELRESLAAAHHDREALALRLRASKQVQQERDALAGRLQELEKTRFQIMRTIAHDLGTVSLAHADVARPGIEEASRTTPQIPAPTGRAQLVVQDSSATDVQSGTAFDLRPGAVVGRWPGSDIEISDSFMSGDHARLSLHDGRWWITDLGSTNGTFVNGVRINQPTPLCEGNEVRFGRLRTQFTVQAAPHQVLPQPRTGSNGRVRGYLGEGGLPVDPGEGGMPG